VSLPASNIASMKPTTDVLAGLFEVMLER